MRNLDDFELAAVSGGDHWGYENADGGIDESRIGAASASYTSLGNMGGSTSTNWQSSASTLLSQAAAGFQNAMGDCANGAAVGALLLGWALGPVGGGAAGCVINTGAGIIRAAPGTP